MPGSCPSRLWIQFLCGSQRRGYVFQAGCDMSLTSNVVCSWSSFYSSCKYFATRFWRLRNFGPLSPTTVRQVWHAISDHLYSPKLNYVIMILDIRLSAFHLEIKANIPDQLDISVLALYKPLLLSHTLFPWALKSDGCAFCAERDASCRLMLCLLFWAGSQRAVVVRCCFTIHASPSLSTLNKPPALSSLTPTLDSNTPTWPEFWHVYPQ